MNETYLSDASFNKIEAALLAEVRRRNSDRYFGLLSNTADELGKALKDKNFAVDKTEHRIKAVLFDTLAECELHCKLAPEYSAMDFEKFKEVAGDSWRNPSHYYPQKGSNAIVFLCEW